MRLCVCVRACALRVCVLVALAIYYVSGASPRATLAARWFASPLWPALNIHATIFKLLAPPRNANSYLASPFLSSVARDTRLTNGRASSPRGRGCGAVVGVRLK